ncbi:MAG: excalibur calcium-binding domain-containing protein [Tabrizicola sp.]
MSLADMSVRSDALVAVLLAAALGQAALAQDCDPNYAGACVPVASDVDCSGGQGNGPAYVTGPVRVTGTDIYDLDRDGDGVACEPEKQRKKRKRQ